MTGFAGQIFATSVENVGASLNQVLNVYFAGAAGFGAVATNAYALRIALLPLSGIVSPANQILHVSLSRDRANNIKIRFAPIAIKLSCVWLILAVAIILLREQIVTLVYQRGAFSHRDTLNVASVLIPYSCYFFVMATNQVYARYFFSISQGGQYSGFLIAGYVIGNVLKPHMAAVSGLSGVIWACVIGEGLSALYFTLKMLYTETFTTTSAESLAEGS
jgi:putative peptidoglycan lipid II flippase